MNASETSAIRQKFNEIDLASPRNTVDSMKRSVSLLGYEENVCSFKRVRLLPENSFRRHPSVLLEDSYRPPRTEEVYTLNSLERDFSY